MTPETNKSNTMRWPQFVLTLTNLSFAIYVLLLNVFFVSDSINSYTFLWTLIYLALAIAISHLYMLYMSNKIDDWYDVESMKGITNLSIVSIMVCAIALLVGIGVEYYQTKAITLFKKGEVLKSSMTPLIASLICSTVLFTSSIKFKKYVTLCRSIDLQPTQTQRNYRTTD